VVVVGGVVVEVGAMSMQAFAQSACVENLFAFPPQPP
jgi:hypothetical protein